MVAYLIDVVQEHVLRKYYERASLNTSSNHGRSRFFRLNLKIFIRHYPLTAVFRHSISKWCGSWSVQVLPSSAVSILPDMRTVTIHRPVENAQNTMHTPRIDFLASTPRSRSDEKSIEDDNSLGRKTYQKLCLRFFARMRPPVVPRYKRWRCSRAAWCSAHGICPSNCRVVVCVRGAARKQNSKVHMPHVLAGSHLCE